METEVRSVVGKSAGYSAKKSFIISVLMLIIAGICATAEAKSVYAITDHGQETVTAYHIQGNQLEFPYATSFNHGELINITADMQRRILFITVEGSGIFCVDADTLTEKGYSSTSCELAGIVFDELRQKIYAAGRQTDQLYIYTWNGTAFELMDQVTLVNLGGEGAYGIALDKVSDRLYVANNTAVVHYYDVNDPDWAHLGSRNVGSQAMDIDVDPYRGYLYVGGYQEGGGGEYYLIKHNLRTDQNPNQLQDIGTMVVGVAVDTVSGLVYVTTWSGQVRVYDCSSYPFSQTYSVTNESHPAGICVESSGGLRLTKVDDVNDCVTPGREITFTISYSYPDDPNLPDINNAIIIDDLPAGVDWGENVVAVPAETDPNEPEDPNFIFDPNNIFDPNFVWPEPEEETASISAGVYDHTSHTVTWQFTGDIKPGDSGSVSFSVIVNYRAEPGLMLHNVAKLISDNEIVAIATEDTPICCWDTTDPNIIFTDKTATGNNNGTSWTDAYTNLQDALYRAENTACENVDTIFLAQGVYSPGDSTNDRFKIPDGFSVYGGFKSGGCDFEYRNPTIYVTALTGYIDPNNRNESVVVMGDNSLLNGVVVRDSDNYGVTGSGVDFTVSNCTIKENRYGIYSENGNVSIKWSSIENNVYDGVHHLNGGTSLTVENSQIIRNGQNGIYDANSIPTIKNSVICGNGIEGMGYWGIYISDPKGTPLLHNCTIAYNYNEAIAYTDSDSNHDNLPDIQNCIIWYNNDNGEQFAGYKPPRHYSCIYDPNYPDGTNETIDSNHNFSHKPDFAYPYSTDPNVFINVHLQYNSFCKNKGSLNLSYVGQTDIDNEDRVADSVVDVGADEITCSEIYNPYDFNGDGIVGMADFGRLSQVWLAHDPNAPDVLDPNNPVNDPNSPYYIKPSQLAAWYPDGWKFNLSTDGDSAYSIDTADLLVFLDESPWCWAACWRHDIQEMQQSMMMGSSMALESSWAAAVPTVAASASEPIFETFQMDSEDAILSIETAEEVDPAVEQANILSLIEDIDGLINAGGDDAEAWQEIKNLLEQALVDTEDAANDPNEF